jgi:hypothetical protein
LHVADEFLERLCLIDRIRINRVGVENGLAYIAERLVNQVHERMNLRRLLVPGND